MSPYFPKNQVFSFWEEIVSYNRTKVSISSEYKECCTQQCKKTVHVSGSALKSINMQLLRKMLVATFSWLYGFISFLQKNGSPISWGNWNHISMQALVICPVLKHAGRTAIFFHSAWKSFIGPLWIFRRHCLYMPGSLFYGFPSYSTKSIFLSCYVVYSITPTIYAFIVFSFFFPFSFISFISISHPIPMTIVGVERSVMTSYIVLFETSVFQASLNSLAFSLTRCPRWVTTVVVPAEKGAIESMDLKVSQRTSAQRISQLLKWENPALWKFGIEHICQVLRACSTLHTYELGDSRIRKLFFYHFVNGMFLSLRSAMYRSSI